MARAALSRSFSSSLRTLARAARRALREDPRKARASPQARPSRKWRRAIRVPIWIAKHTIRSGGSQRILARVGGKTPSLEHLHAGRLDSSPQGLYAEALIAAFEQRPEEALVKIHAALATSPWFYEAIALEIQLAFLQGETSNHLAEQSRSLPAERLAALGEKTTRLLRLAPSYPEAYWRESYRWYESGRNQEYTDPVASEAAYRKGLGWANEGLKVDARSPDLLVARARCLWVMGELALRRGRPGGEYLLEAREAADLAVVVAPRRGDVQRCRAQVLAAQAASLGSSGKDSAPVVEQGLNALQRAMALDGRDLPGLRTLAWLQGLLAEARLGQGKDPRPAYRDAIATYEEVLQRAPEDYMANNNVAEMYGDLFTLALEEGSADLAQLERGLALLERENLRYPRLLDAWNTRVFLLRLRARYSREHGEDPGPYLTQGRAVAHRELALRTVDSEAFSVYGDLELEAARAALAKGRLPLPALAAAEEAFRHARLLNGKDSRARAGLAEAALVRCESMKGRPGADLVEEGIVHAKAALALNGANQQARLVLGSLYVQKARGQSGATAREAARAAIEALEQALGMAPVFGRTYGPRLEEARRLAGKA